MASPDFRFFALRYLDDWYADDQRFFNAVSGRADAPGRLDTFWEAAKYYKVTRTLPLLDGEARLAAALQAIDDVADPVNESIVDEAVCGLAERFRQLYGRYAISAASKFLWLRKRWPVVILDDRADECLRGFGHHFGKGDYPAYRRAWRSTFWDHEPAIRQACDDVIGAKQFSLAGDESDHSIRKWTSAPWFRERVFDKFLWWYGPNHDVSEP